MSNGGRITKSPEFQSLEENRLKVLSDHIDQLQAALGPARFEALDALVKKNNFPRGGPQNQSVLTVLDVDGQSTRISFAGMAYMAAEKAGRQLAHGRPRRLHAGGDRAVRLGTISKVQMRRAGDHRSENRRDCRGRGTSSPQLSDRPDGSWYQGRNRFVESQDDIGRTLAWRYRRGVEIEFAMLALAVPKGEGRKSTARSLACTWPLSRPTACGH